MDLIFLTREPYTLRYLKLGLDLLPKNWEFRVFAKQAMSKKLGLLRFRQTCLVQKIGTYTKYLRNGKCFQANDANGSSNGYIYEK